MLSRFQEDLKLHEDGSPCELFGMTFYVRRLNGKWQNALIEAKRDVLKDPFLGKSLTEEQEMEALGMAVSSYLVKDWENVRQFEDGEQIKFNYGNAKAIFCNPEYTSLVTELLAFAGNKENYLQHKVNEDIDIAKKLFAGTTKSPAKQQ